MGLVGTFSPHFARNSVALDRLLVHAPIEINVTGHLKVIIASHWREISTYRETEIICRLDREVKELLQVIISSASEYMFDL